MPLERIGLDGNRISYPLNCMRGHSSTTTSFFGRRLVCIISHTDTENRNFIPCTSALLPRASSLEKGLVYTDRLTINCISSLTKSVGTLSNTSKWLLLLNFFGEGR